MHTLEGWKGGMVIQGGSFVNVHYHTRSVFRVKRTGLWSKIKIWVVTIAQSGVNRQSEVHVSLNSHSHIWTVPQHFPLSDGNPPPWVTHLLMTRSRRTSSIKPSKHNNLQCSFLTIQKSINNYLSQKYEYFYLY